MGCRQLRLEMEWQRVGCKDLVAAAGTAMGDAPAASTDMLVAAMWLASALCLLMVVVVMTIVQDVLLRCGGQLGQ
jgi:hypothetical protein